MATSRSSVLKTDAAGKSRPISSAWFGPDKTARLHPTVPRTSLITVVSNLPVVRSTPFEQSIYDCSL